MDAYVFGNHPGELPTMLLGTESGNRVRALARLDGGDYDVFYALETQSAADVERHVEAIKAAGTQVMVVWHGHGEAQLGLIPLPKPTPPPPMPAWVPPIPWLLFLIAEVADIVILIESLRERFGVEYVAACRTPDGRYLVEVGAERSTDLSAALDELAPLAGVSGGVAHVAAGVQRA